MISMALKKMKYLKCFYKRMNFNLASVSMVEKKIFRKPK